MCLLILLLPAAVLVGGTTLLWMRDPRYGVGFAIVVTTVLVFAVWRVLKHFGEE